MANSRSAGDVSVRFSVQDAEVVRTALEALGKDGQAALNRIDAASRTPSAGLKAVSAVMADLRGQATGMAGGLGLVGDALLAIGPAGLVAGAAAGGIYLLFSTIKDGAKEFGNFSRSVKDNSEAVGLSSAQYQAATRILQEHGVEEEKGFSILAKISKGREEAAHSAGALYDVLKAQKYELATQFSSATSLAEAIDILSKAYATATDKQRAFIIAAAAGKGSALAGPAFLDLFNKGGLDAYTNALIKSGQIFQTEVIDKQAGASVAAQQKSQFVERAWNEAYAAIYSKWKDFKKTIGLGEANEVAFAVKVKMQVEEGNASGIMAILGRIVGMASPTAGAAITLGGAAAGGIVAGQNNLDRLKADLGAAEEQRANVRPSLLPAHDAEIARLRGRIGYIENNQFGPNQPPEALPQFGPPKATADDLKAATQEELQKNVPNEEKRLALLGETASATERVKVETDKLTLAILNGVGKTKDNPEGLTTEQTDRIKANYQVVEDAKQLAARTTLGIASESEIAEQHLAELREKFAKAGVVSAEQRATAERLVRKESLETANAIAAKASATPALTKLSQDSDNLAKNLDEGLASSLRSVGQEFSLLNTSTDTFGQKLTNVTLKIADAAYQAVLMKVAIKPLADMVSGGLGSLGSSLFGLPKSVVGANGPLATPTFSALGNIFDRGGLSRFAMGGVVSRPTFFPFANGTGLMGEAGPEAIMPLTRLPGGMLGVRNMGGGGGGSVIHQHFYLDGAMSKDDVTRMVKQAAGSAMRHTDARIQQYDHGLPSRIGNIQRDNF